MKTITQKDIVDEGIIALKGVRLNGGGLNRVLIVTMSNKYIVSRNSLQYVFEGQELKLVNVAFEKDSLDVLSDYDQTWTEQWFLGSTLPKYDQRSGQLHERLGYKLALNGSDY